MAILPPKSAVEIDSLNQPAAHKKQQLFLVVTIDNGIMSKILRQTFLFLIAFAPSNVFFFIYVLIVPVIKPFVISCITTAKLKPSVLRLKHQFNMIIFSGHFLLNHRIKLKPELVIPLKRILTPRSIPKFNSEILSAKHDSRLFIDIARCVFDRHNKVARQ